MFPIRICFDVIYSSKFSSIISITIWSMFSFLFSGSPWINKQPEYCSCLSKLTLDLIICWTLRSIHYPKNKFSVFLNLKTIIYKYLGKALFTENHWLITSTIKVSCLETFDENFRVNIIRFLSFDVPFFLKKFWTLLSVKLTRKHSCICLVYLSPGDMICTSNILSI